MITPRARYKNVRLKMSALRLQLHSTTGGDMEGERTFCEVEATAKLEIAVVKEASAAADADVLNRGIRGALFSPVKMATSVTPNVKLLEYHGFLRCFTILRSHNCIDL